MATADPLLSGLRVLDLSIWRPGPYATSLLVGLGADVLKIEPPGGDPMRRYAGLFDAVNAGKRSMVLDLKSEDGAARALALAEQADVLVEGFRPGVMSRLGLGDTAIRALNPAIVYCSISGYGQEGSRASLPGHDVNYQAWAGSLIPDGGTATQPPLPSADLAAGLTAAFGVCAALIGRATSGRGTYLDISMTDVMATWTGSAAPGPARGAVTPGYGLFATSDGGQVALGVVNEQHFWDALCAELGLGALAGLDVEERIRRGADLQEAVASTVATRERDQLVAALVGVGVPVAPVLDRTAMLDSAPFPSFPIRLPLPDTVAAVPALDEHNGQGFHERP
jgi:crotonobetainyl-CoA:carnitine CoA-transferase CaiB-like acyl-CoA transferase